MKLLFLVPGPVPPAVDDSLNRFLHLSQICEGDILLPVWFDSEKSAIEKMGPRSIPHKIVGRFKYTFLYLFRYKPQLRSLAALAFFLRRGHEMLKSGDYDALVSYGTAITGLAAAILSRIHGVPLITEVPGVPEKAFVLDSSERTWGARAKKFASDKILDFVLASSAAIELRYPTQLPDRFRSLRAERFVLNAFVPVSAIQPQEEQPEILLVGFPWYLKGADVLCKAFQAIRQEIPGFTLVLMGHYPDRAALARSIGSMQGIEIRNPVPYPEALRRIAACAVLVLPSRTEAMGRVILEAMAAGRPVIGSRVDGIPFYIEHGKTGLLFDSENIEQLAECLKKLCLEADYRHRMGREARLHSQSKFSERNYVEAFEAMLRAVLASESRRA